MAGDVQGGIRDSAELRARLRVVVRSCQECHQAWTTAVETQARHESSQAYGRYLEELFQLIEPVLKQIVELWLVDRHLLGKAGEQEPAQAARQEVVETFVLSTFTYIAERLFHLSLDEGSDIYTELFALAAHYLHRRSRRG